MFDLMHTSVLLGWANCADKDIMIDFSELIGLDYDLIDTQDRL